MAAKVNKYRKVQKRLGDSVEVDDAFDPEKYAARLEAFEAAELPEDDGWGRGKHGRLPPADADSSPAGRGEDPDSAWGSLQMFVRFFGYRKRGSGQTLSSVAL